MNDDTKPIIIGMDIAHSASVTTYELVWVEGGVMMSEPIDPIELRNTWIIPEDTYQNLVKWTREAEEADWKLAGRQIIQCGHPEKPATKRQRRRMKRRAISRG